MSDNCQIEVEEEEPMSENPVQDLIRHLQLEKLEANRFRGESRDVGQKSVFGGQVLAQALLAAGSTVDGRPAHSLHGYFLLPGDPGLPIDYDVELLRDGRSFTTRRVVGIQKGRTIFNMSASFHVQEEGIDHQIDMPEAPPAGKLTSAEELGRQAAEKAPPKVREFLTMRRPIEFRPVDPTDLLHPESRPPHRRTWLRTGGKLPDDPGLHQAVIAYASDFALLGTALLPHGLSFLQGSVQAASLDHAMWFHRPFRADEWLLYDMDSPSACGARGFARGSLFSSDGRLVASVAQEGLLRQRMKERSQDI
ncbi:MAG: acyl-CoA thioesterase II [Desulfuromonadales bacterium]